MTMGAVHGKDEPQTIPSRAGFRFGKGMDMREDGSEFIFYRRGAEAREFPHALVKLFHNPPSNCSLKHRF